MSNHTHKHPKAAGARSGLGRRALLTWGAAGVAGALAGVYLFRPGSAGHGRSAGYRGGETAPVLDGLQFADRDARLAYLAAARHPDVLDQLYCYCHCDRPPFLHKSLLTCFTDRHGAG